MNRKQASSQFPLYYRTVLALAIAVALGGGTASAGEKLDMSFIQGGGDMDPEIWAVLNGSYAPGRYLVDLILNGKDTGKQILDVTPQDSEELCLPEAWLTKAGVYISLDYFRDGYDTTRQCYVLTKAPSVNVDFDVSTQTLALAIPQKGLVKIPENVEWDYGTSAFRVNYNVNANTGKNNTSAFGSADLKANIGRWVVSSSATASNSDNGDNTATINMFTATRAIGAMSADLAVGRTSTGDSLLGSTGTYGVSLSRNNSMKPGNLGYTPVFSGIANGPSRVTLTQNGRLLYSEMVPAGPFSITDVSLYTSGDVTMKVTGEDGREYAQNFPLSVIAGQLSPGEHEFSVAAGMPDDDSNIKGGVFAASYGYGLDGLSLRGGGVFNPDWHPGNVIASYYYRDDNGKEKGLTGTMSTQIKGVSLNLGVSGSRNSQGENNWSASASVSVPFTLFDHRYSNSTSVTTSKGGGTGFSTGVSGSLNDRFSYGVGGGRDSSGGASSYLNTSYSGDRAYLSGTLNHSSGSGTSGSVSASGSVLAVPAVRDVMFSRTSSDTVAVVSVKDTPGVRVTSGNGETNHDGNLVVPLSSYDWNTVTIDAGTLPLNTELSTTSQKVVPTDKAVVWMPFDALNVRRYLLQVKQRNGEFVPGGTWARDSKNTPLGFVANNGVLMINAVDVPGDITLGQCRIPAKKLQETEKLQEITCE
ncbi:TPA: fimbria/pilus outer membrane usher protein [Salmonella enterica]|nr:fimbria/pilus outer membrane usher protein [Salmonella enterica]